MPPDELVFVLDFFWFVFFIKEKNEQEATFSIFV